MVMEAFTTEVKDAVALAADTSRRLGDDMIRSEHLLFGALVAGKDQQPIEVLAAAGVRAETVRPELRDFLGPDAAEDLAALGIDLGTLTSQVEAVFGRDALREAGPVWPRIPFSPHGKAAMNQTVPEARVRGADKVDIVDLLCAVLHPGLSVGEQEQMGRWYVEMARREGLYDGEKGARRVVRALGADPDELVESLRSL